MEDCIRKIHVHAIRHTTASQLKDLSLSPRDWKNPHRVPRPCGEAPQDKAIVGWVAVIYKRTKLVTDALDMALWQRDRDGQPGPAGP